MSTDNENKEQLYRSEEQDEKDNVIDSLFAFANREEERELFDFSEESFNIDLNLKEKAVSILSNIKEIFK